MRSGAQDTRLEHFYWTLEDLAVSGDSELWGRVSRAGLDAEGLRSFLRNPRVPRAALEVCVPQVLAAQDLGLTGLLLMHPQCPASVYRSVDWLNWDLVAERTTSWELLRALAQSPVGDVQRAAERNRLFGGLGLPRRAEKRYALGIL